MPIYWQMNTVQSSRTPQSFIVLVEVSQEFGIQNTAKSIQTTREAHLETKFT
jgi:hypothetical protein